MEIGIDSFPVNCPWSSWTSSLPSCPIIRFHDIRMSEIEFVTQHNSKLQTRLWLTLQANTTDINRQSESAVAQLCLTQWITVTQWIPARLFHPWGFPGKNTAVGCCFLLQGIFLIQESNMCLLHCRLTLYCLSHQGSPT